MRISAIIMPFVAIVAGVAGFYLRLQEQWNVFKDGLPDRGAVITIVLISLSAAFLLAALAFALRASRKHKVETGFENAFGTDQLSYPIALSIIGAVWLGATVMRFVEVNSSGDFSQIDLVFLITSALSAVSIAFFAIEMYQNPRSRIAIALSIVPTLHMCFWLILMYRQNAPNPILLSYAYFCLAIITSTLGFYFTSGFAYNKPAPGKAIFSYLSAIYFCFVTMADSHAFGIEIIMAALVAINTVYASMLIKNLRWKERDNL